MKRGWVKRNRNKAPLIHTTTINPGLKSFSYSHGFLQEHHLIGISMAGWTRGSRHASFLHYSFGIG